ncbi:MAG: sigma-70 family RNA polymerase sigma factor [Actinobacteria bacterium]|nr:sigma-70 family RNA polymerase sigma factor [Actinomycetota bacterium]
MDESSDADVIVRSLEEPQAFAAVFDRHAALLFRFLIRRVTADELLGETFRVAFERRVAFDPTYRSARPWIYGIATNLLARHRRTEGRRLAATAQLAGQSQSDAFADNVAAAVDAHHLWPRVADAIASLPDGERDALLLFAWEQLSYGEIAAALEIPVGTVRSRLNRARRRIRELVTAAGEQAVKTPVDQLEPPERNDPWKLAEERDRLMSVIDKTEVEPQPQWRAPAIYPRLAYVDEMGALEFLTTAFGFRERREARMGTGTADDHLLAWLEYGDGVVMIGHAEHEVHQIFSPQEVGTITCMVNVSVDDVDAHYAQAVAAGATITMEINDAFYGERRYEALDLEGNKWHFGEALTSVQARRGRTG